MNLDQAKTRAKELSLKTSTSNFYIALADKAYGGYQISSRWEAGTIAYFFNGKEFDC